MGRFSYTHGSTYNIPVCVWLYQTHPQSRCPSVPMVINPRCPYVEASKQVLLDCLVTWKSKRGLHFKKKQPSLPHIQSDLRRYLLQHIPVHMRSLQTLAAGLNQAALSQKPQTPQCHLHHFLEK
ncbi:uncharacterized protein ACWYII_041972 isoform 1-T1 [Salvelinus alpinus]